tara:strand:- start:835 stop:1530 length:696 start_codon:yes stop_codon:yes gene_type:complete
MPATYSEITSVTAGSAATVGDINQYKEALEGNRDFIPFLWAKTANNIVMRVGDQVGVNYFDIQDSAGVSQFKVDSNGNITSTDVLTSTRTGRLASDAVNATTTLADVTGISFSIGASEVWVYDLMVMTDSPTGTDYKIGWTYPASCTMDWASTSDPAQNLLPISTTFNEVVAISANWAKNSAGLGTVAMDTYSGTIVNDTTAGIIQLQFAANTVGTATLKANSYLVATKVS